MQLAFSNLRWVDSLSWQNSMQQLLATTSQDNSVTLRDVSTAKQVGRVTFAKPTTQVIWNPVIQY
jgi:hypothetical protein